jgi:hypothetical protein
MPHIDARLAAEVSLLTEVPPEEPAGSDVRKTVLTAKVRSMGPFAGA